MNTIRRLQTTQRTRDQLHKQADSKLGKAGFDPREALELLKSLKAPVGPVEQMIAESGAERYSKN